MQSNGRSSGKLFIEDREEQQDLTKTFTELQKVVDEIYNGIDHEIDAAEAIEKLRLENQKEYWKLDKVEREKLKDQQAAMIDDLIKIEHKQRLDKAEELANIAAKGNKKEADKLYKQQKKQIDKEIAYKAKQAKAQTKKDAKDAKNEQFKAAQADVDAKVNALKSAKGNKLKAMWNLTKDQNGVQSLSSVLSGLTNLMGNLVKDLEKTADEVALKQGTVDTRLQGSNKSTKFGSYWREISSNISKATAMSPLLKQQDVFNKVESMISQGISFNVEQRAALDVMKDKIAGTFDTTNATLLRLVRIQQQDTTAARLGMESALTAFLNNMYDTTEYMGSIANGIKGSLEEAMSIMSGENALSFEYQVQKWMGSMYSVGMNQSSVSSLAGVIGQIAAGQLEGITNGTTGNLALMAASRAGLSISDLMMDGMSDTETNKLMQSMVNYLSEIYNETKDNNVLQQQYAQIYGLNASDLKAISNLATSVNDVSKYGLTYQGAINQLNSMAGSMYSRTSLGELMSNSWANAKYGLAQGLANNPVLYGLIKTADILDSVADGINFGTPLVMGSGYAGTFNVADIMRSGALLGSTGHLVADMVAGAGSGFSGTGILNALGVNNGPSIVTRGSGVGTTTFSGGQLSESGNISMNSDLNDVSGSTMASQTDENNNNTVEAGNSSDEVKLSTVNSNIEAMLEFFKTAYNDLTFGNSRSLNVKITNSAIEPIPMATTNQTI